MWFCKILCLQVRFSKYNHKLIHIMLNNAYIIGIKWVCPLQLKLFPATCWSVTAVKGVNQIIKVNNSLYVAFISESTNSYTHSNCTQDEALNNCFDLKRFTRVLIHHSAVRPALVLIVHLMKYVSHKCNTFTVRFISCLFKWDLSPSFPTSGITAGQPVPCRNHIQIWSRGTELRNTNSCLWVLCRGINITNRYPQIQVLGQRGEMAVGYLICCDL